MLPLRAVRAASLLLAGTGTVMSCALGASGCGGQIADPPQNQADDAPGSNAAGTYTLQGLTTTDGLAFGNGFGESVFPYFVTLCESAKDDVLGGTLVVDSLGNGTLSIDAPCFIFDVPLVDAHFSTTAQGVSALVALVPTEALVTSLTSGLTSSGYGACDPASAASVASTVRGDTDGSFSTDDSAAIASISLRVSFAAKAVATSVAAPSAPLTGCN